MSRKLLRASNFIFFIFIVSNILLSEVSQALESQMNHETSLDNFISIEIEESRDTLDESKTNSSPDLGDDQTFPFIPGFGKNSSKD